jgi:hypothetical protein
MINKIFDMYNCNVILKIKIKILPLQTFKNKRTICGGVK